MTATHWYDANLKNVFCYAANKFAMLSDLQALYKLYLSGELGGIPKSTIISFVNKFNETFESSWFIPKTHILQFGEDFEAPWFDENTYLNEYGEGFETSWFINNTYINQDGEDFEGVDWNE